MSEIIAIMNQKGGCGKTTTTVNLATSLAVLGKSVLIIDMDPQGNATTSFGYEKGDIEKTIYSALMGEINIKEATINTFIRNLFIIPSNMSLSGAGVELSRMENYHVILKNVLKDITHIFDYILIDLPPSLGILTINAMVASDSVIIPIQAEYYALEGVADLINTVELVESRLRSPTPIKGILLTLYDKRTNLSKEVQTELNRFFKNKEHLFKTIIPRNIKLAEAPSHGQPCLIYDPDSSGSKAYMNLANEILELETEAK